MRTLGLLLCLLLTPTAGMAASWVGQTCTAADATQAEVQACINGVTASMSGSVTISIPADSKTWTTNVTLALADVYDPAPNFANVTSVTIAGAGASSTVITDNIASTTPSTGAVLYVSGLDTKRFTVTGLGFVSLNYAAIYVVGTTGLTNPATAGFRIHNNAFTSTDQAEHCVWIAGNTYGLVDNNAFTSCKVQVENNIATLWTNQDSKFTDDQELGTAKFVFVEDNTIRSTANVYTNAIDANAAGRVVFRFNTMVDTYLETHSGCPDCFRGVRALEYYRNQMSVVNGGSGAYRVGLIRSGTGVIHGNTVTSGTFTRHSLDVDNEASCIARACASTGTVTRITSNNTRFDHGTTPSCRDDSGNPTFPCQDQIGRGKDGGWTTAQAIEPLYAWSNTTAASAEIPIAANPGSCAYTSTVLAANRDYYNYTATFDGTSGVGVGLISAIPVSCTAGVAYWATDEGDWNKMPSGTNGKLYKCTATGNPGTWTEYYTPYTYPHPLRGFIEDSPEVGTITLGGSGTMTPGAGGTITLGP